MSLENLYEYGNYSLTLKGSYIAAIIVILNACMNSLHDAPKCVNVIS